MRDNRQSERQPRQKQLKPKPSKQRKKMTKGRDPRSKLSTLETLLRWWAGIFFGLVILNFLTNAGFALAGGGPKAVQAYFQSFQYVTLLATRYPLLFWPVAVLLIGSAVIGAVLIGIELWQKCTEHTTQRKIYLAAVQSAYQIIPLVIDPELKIPLPEPVYQRLSYVQRSAYSQEDENRPSYVKAKYITDILKTSISVCVVLLGDPGGGKTTFLRQSMFDLAKTALGDDSFPLPVYIALPAFAKFIEKDEPNAVKNYFLEQASILLQMRIAPFAEVIQNAVESGRAFLFLDSLDEVDPGTRKLVIDWILKQQASVSAQGAVVLGTRYTDYDPARFAPGNRTLTPYQEFSELVAQMMDHDIRVHLAEELFGPLVEQIKRLFPDQARTLQTPIVADFIDLIEQTSQQEALLGKNPLLFSLAAYLYVRGGRQTLPTSRIAVYRTFIKALLTKVVLRRQQKDTAIREMVLMNETLQVLAEVALWTFLHLEGAIDFTEQMLVEALKEIKETIRITGIAEHMATWVIDSGMLAPERADRYAFRHHTIQEYLVTVALSKRLLTSRLRDATWTLLRQKRFIPLWSEPMRMLAGVLVEGEHDVRGASRYAKEWLAELAHIAEDRHAAEQNAAIELAAASLPDVPDMAVFGTEIQTQDLLELWAEKLLQAAQTGQSDWVGRLQRMNQRIALLPAVFVEPAITRLQAALIDEEHPAGQKAAAQVMEKLGNLVTNLDPLIHVLHSQTQRDVRIASAHTLAVVELRDSLQLQGLAILSEAVQGTDGELAHIVAMGLNGAGERARQVMELAVAKERDRETRRLGTIALGSLGPGARQKLAALAADAEPIVAATAAAILQNLGAPKEELRKRLLELAEHGDEVLAQVQSLLPQTLRRLGFSVIVHQGNEIIIPPMVTIPAGAFLMGSDKQKDSQAGDDELPQFRFTLKEYAIGKYPLTVAEYACFIKATGHKEPSHWNEQQHHADHPVVNGSWYDMRDYAQWLALVTGQSYRLPTEAEWEKAARGTDGRIYPWGNEWDQSKANTSKGGKGTTTPIGSYPQGASPYGCLDMAGNVWEWTSTMYIEKYPYKYDKKHEDWNSTNSRVLRGGSWFDYPRYARVACRNNFDFDRSNFIFGVRVVRGGVAG